MKKLIFVGLLMILQRVGFSQDLASLRDMYFDIEIGNDTLSISKTNLLKRFKVKLTEVNGIEAGEVNYYIANLYRLKNDGAKAIKYYKRSLNLNFSDSSTIYSLIALTFGTQKKYAKSIKYYEKAFLLDSLSGMTSYNLANAYKKKRRYSLSVQYFKKALILKYREEWVYFGLYDVVFQQNKADIKSLCYANIKEFGDDVVSRYFLVKSDLSEGNQNQETIKNFERLKELDLKGEYYIDFKNFE